MKLIEFAIMIAMLIAVLFAAGCVSNEAEVKGPAKIYTTERAFGNYIVTINDTIPYEVTRYADNECIKISNGKNLTMCLIDVGKGNDTDIILEKSLRNAVWNYNWHKAGVWYDYIPSMVIHGFHAKIATGYPKYQPEEVLTAYYPLPGVMMLVHSYFTKQETTDILNETTVKWL